MGRGTAARPRRSLGLAPRLIVTNLALVLGVVLLFGGMNNLQQSRLINMQSTWLLHETLDHVRRRAEQCVRDLSESCRSALLANDLATLQALLPRLAPAADKEIAYILLVDENQTVVAASDPSRNGRPPDHEAEQQLATTSYLQERRYGEGDGAILGFAQPIKYEGRRVGAVVVGFRLAPTYTRLRSFDSDKSRILGDGLLRTVLAGVACILAGAAIAIGQAMLISRPVVKLARGAERIAHGDLGARVDVRGVGEIAHLAESFNFMTEHLVNLLETTAVRAAAVKELEVARTIQETLVPTSDVVEGDGVQVAGYYLPTSTCSGDWWAVNELPDGRLLLAIGDATGHGAPAAMITACAKAAWDTARELAGADVRPGWLLERMNRAILASARRQFLMTCFAAVVDVRRGTLTFANAGHNFPYLNRSGDTSSSSGSLPRGTGGNVAGGLMALAARGNRLGDVEESVFEERTQPVGPGDLLVLFTDGVIECESERGEELGEKRFRALLRQVAARGEATEVRAQLTSELLSFFGARVRKDDVTLVVARFT